MKALISPQETVNGTSRVVAVEAVEFNVAPPLFWVPCNSNIRVDMRFKDGVFSDASLPTLTLAEFKAAHDWHINAPALARGYDSFATFALRAMRAGPWQAEGILFYDWMEACNVAGYTLLNEVESGNRAAPLTINEYLELLPPLPEELQ